MDVYWELVMGLNFLVDLLLLCAANRLCGCPVRYKRQALAAAIGSIYGGLCLLKPWAFLAGGLGRVLSFLVMGAIAFGLDRSGLRRMVVFFLLSMALGGLATGLGPGSTWTLVLAGAVLWALCQLTFGGRVGETYVPVTITYKAVKLRLTALVDTGNTLQDPLTGAPVLVVGEAAAYQLAGLTPQQLRSPLQTMASGQYKGLRLVPYSAVGVTGGFLLALQPEKLLVDGKERDHLVAFAPNEIGQGRAFEALAGGLG